MEHNINQSASAGASVFTRPTPVSSKYGFSELWDGGEEMSLPVEQALAANDISALDATMETMRTISSTVLGEAMLGAALVAVSTIAGQNATDTSPRKTSALDAPSSLPSTRKQIALCTPAASGLVVHRTPELPFVELEYIVGAEQLLTSSTELVLDTAASLLDHLPEASVISELPLIEDPQGLFAFDTPYFTQAPGAPGSGAITSEHRSINPGTNHPHIISQQLLDGTIDPHSPELHGGFNFSTELLSLATLLTGLSPLLDMDHLTQFPFPIISVNSSMASYGDLTASPPALAFYEDLPVSLPALASTDDLGESIISLIVY